MYYIDYLIVNDFMYRSNKAERLNKNNQLKKIKRDNVWLQKRTGTFIDNLTL